MPRLFVLFALCLALSPCNAATAPPDADFAIRDFLGRNWRNESVHFPLRPDQLQRARAQAPLVGPDNKPVPYQISDDGKGNVRIEFLANVPAFERAAWRFAGGRATSVSDLRVEEDADSVRLYNSRVGIRLRKQLEAGAGPVSGLRSANGPWFADSTLEVAQRVGAYRVEIASRGPISAEVICTAAFADGTQWTLRFRLQADEPVLLVDETFNRTDAAAFRLQLDRDFKLTHILYRHGNGDVGKLAADAIESAGDEPLFVLEPWLHWWQRQHQGTWFGLYGPDAALVAVGARDGPAWVDAARAAGATAPGLVALTRGKQGVQLALPLARGARKWTIAVLPKEASIEALQASNAHVAPLPQQYFVKHADFPLDRVKDYVLDWRGDETDHPRLIVTPKDVAAMRARSPNGDEGWRRPAAPLTVQTLDAPLRQYLLTGDRELGKDLAAYAERWLQESVDMFLRQDRLVTLGYGPHHQTSMLATANLLDAVWSSAEVTPGARAKFKAQVAFLAYTVNRDDYWSPVRGFGANPNMTTTVSAYQVALGSLIPAHPLAKTWVNHGLAELKGQVDQWADENGGWLEAPHYAIVAYDYFLGGFIAAQNAGFSDYLFHPTMRKVGEWLAQLSTPPDSLANGHRALLPIGNTWMRTPVGVFGTLAFVWRDRDPAFAARMQWMHKEHGSPVAPTIGGFLPALAGYRTLLSDPKAAAEAPRYASEWFPRTGAMLRAHFPSARETQLHLIAGKNHDHYDRDSGSFTLWGKGRLIANEFGYYGNAPGDDHNMVVSPDAADGAIAEVADFMRGDDVDYVRAVKTAAWQRQIVFVKDPSPLGPNYYVISDAVTRGGPGTWRTWFSAERVSRQNEGALIEGREDVNTELYFLQPVSWSTETRSRETWGMNGDKYGRVTTTQLAVIAPITTASPLTAVYYPRLKTDKGPTFTTLAAGKAVRIETAAGTDYVFLSATPFSFADSNVSFEGSVGAVLFRNGRPRLWLGKPGKLRGYGQTLARDGADAR